MTRPARLACAGVGTYTMCVTLVEFPHLPHLVELAQSAYETDYMDDRWQMLNELEAELAELPSNVRGKVLARLVAEEPMLPRMLREHHLMLRELDGTLE